MFNVLPLGQQNKKTIQQKINLKTKPPGALGQLETLALQLAMITGPDTIQLNKPVMLVFAGDHGIAKEGVSIAPSEVTQQMVANFLAGGAAVNCFCRANEISLEVIDAGILNPIENEQLTVQRLGAGTCNFVEQSAMSIDAVKEGIQLGAKVIYRHVGLGTNVFCLGEMGIGNTSSASAILSGLTDLSAQETVGKGTGVADEVLQRKIKLIQQALDKHQSQFDSVENILAAVGGFEIVQMVGAYLAAAEKQCVVLVDGFIASVAALAAVRINSNVADYLVFCHRSNEQAHKIVLEELNANPLLDLGLRLGEGTGAALAYPLIKSAAAFYNEMASFESAGISAV